MTGVPASLPRFPCHPVGTPKEKRPCIKGWQGAASSDPAQIAEWEQQFPGCLWGVPTGPATGLFVVDIDPKAKGWLKEKLADGSLPRTYSHRTRRGYHFFYRWVPGGTSSAGSVAPGVDTRGVGGYVIWWPAAGVQDAGVGTPGEHRVFDPGVLPEPPTHVLPNGVAPAETKQLSVLTAPDLSLESGVYAPWSVDRCFEGLATITVDDGDYDKWREVTWGLRAALAEIGQDNDESFERYHAWSEALPGHTDCTCRRVWDDHNPDRGLGPGTFYHYVKLAAAPLSFKEVANAEQAILERAVAATAAETKAQADHAVATQLKSIGEMCAAWMWIERQKCWWHSTGRYTLDMEAWDAANANQRTPPMMVPGADGQPTIKDGKPLTSKWLLQRTMAPVVTRFLDFDYLPGEPTVLAVRGGLQPKLNKWIGPGVTPTKPPASFMSLWQKYLDGMVQPGEQPAWNYILDTMACLVQRPSYKPPVSLLIVGSPGTGKSTLFEDVMEILVGETNFITASTQNLESQFNSLYLERKVVSIPEMKDLSRASANRLKSIITSNRLTINEKYTKEYQVTNAAMIVATSNFDAPVPVELGDRRWVTVRTAGGKPGPGTPRAKMFGLLHDMLKQDIARGWLHWVFLARDITAWDPYNVPTTVTKHKMIEESLFPWQQDLLDMIRNGTGPFSHPWPEYHGGIPAESIYEVVADSCTGGQFATRKQIGRFISLHFPKAEIMRVMHNGKRVRVWKLAGGTDDQE